MIGGLWKSLHWNPVYSDTPKPRTVVLTARLYRGDAASPSLRQAVSAAYYDPTLRRPWRHVVTRKGLDAVTHWTYLPEPPLLAQQEGVLESMGLSLPGAFNEDDSDAEED